ncbi:DNA cytosine methyltransferase [Pseudovibrio sp. Ad5]|uniref:DNA cytosine methyltransferase n=1 Tax=Pseudovibrio sp. Ad5 TaxID=989436 RepID=UPI0007AEA2DC|nr:DNA cytosine methyltransferase [Pseudovibrio sp. Ad5]
MGDVSVRFIDLFAGCGGLSLGLMKAGWQGVFAIEKSGDAFQTLTHNLCSKRKTTFEWPEWLPQEAMTTRELLDQFPRELEAMRGHIDLIAGGPPCQGFSVAGRRNPEDPRNKLKDEYVEIVNILQPKFLLFENVRGFASAFKGENKKSHADQVREDLMGFEWGGYQVFSRILEASNFAVPQPRARFILMAVRADLITSQAEIDPFDDIDAFCASFRDKRSLNGHNITVKEAISDLEINLHDLAPCLDTKGFNRIDYLQPEELSQFQKLMRKGLRKTQSPNSLRLPNHRAETVLRFQDVLRTCPKGRSLSKEMREKYGMKKQCFTPLDPDRLSRTVTTLPDDLLHYSEPRILTVRENARLQSFPDWFEFQGKYTTGGSRRKSECPRYTQVGNAVPPLMAEALGELLRKLENIL